jgi:hypothetical protein
LAEAFHEYMTIEELEANTRRLAGDPRVTITPVGVSRTGRAIEMITLGEGSRDALIVGVPHPNEPAGAVTVERMIALLLEDPAQRRGYRWNFIKAIDPEGLRLNEGWLKQPRSLATYLENFFRPALHRQPETTFPLATEEFQFDRCTPENEAWQKAFALTRPALHASLHHCDFGGVFYSISRALPAALYGLEETAARSGLVVNEDESAGVMAVERWSPSVSRYPSAPELAANAKASGDAWAYPWTLGEMSPGFGEAEYGTFTIVPEIPQWDAASLRDHASSSGVSRREQERMLRTLVKTTRDIANRHARAFATCALPPDAQEFLWALEGSLKMMPVDQDQGDQQGKDQDDILSVRDFDELYTHHALHVLRTLGYLLGLSRVLLLEQPENVAALEAQHEVREALGPEVAAIEARTTLVPVPLDVLTGFQMRAVFVCADALATAGS